ncbi:hypothetical protein [Psilogramma increta granulovirus]|uniref:Uncharacterized protein n=1 Tax=Psilogramma increta granulovirus TaxID=2953508 RepID=A0A977XU59_9BBAC|nr:hypothetical protein [Psilogramma increta granulovirus]
MSKIINKTRATHRCRVLPYNVVKAQKSTQSNLFYFDWLPQEIYDKIINKVSGNDVFNLTCVYPRQSNKAMVMYNFNCNNTNMNGVFTRPKRVHIQYEKLPKDCYCYNDVDYKDKIFCHLCFYNCATLYKVFVNDPLLGVHRFTLAEEFDETNVMVYVYYNNGMCSVCKNNICATCMFKNDLIKYINEHGLPDFCYVYTLC